MKFKKKYIIISALVLALGAAVYLNWSFSDAGTLLSPASRELGEATHVSASIASADEAARVSKELSDAQQYFAKAKNERKQTEDALLSEAKEVLSLTEGTDDAKQEAAAQLSKLEDRIAAESNIENILCGKGFSECVCFLSDEGCSVAVLHQELEDVGALIVKDTVLSQTSLEFNNITIVEI